LVLIPFQIRHKGSLLWLRLKAIVIEKIDYWHILPSLEEQASMSPSEIQAFVAASV
jgi:hypothetical protein